jgi:CDGSH-type Zn-finger protein
MADVKIQALKNGPLLVKGEMEVLDSNGEVMQSGNQVALCRCGQSSKKPFCDGTHGKVGFQSVCVRQVSS